MWKAVTNLTKIQLCREMDAMDSGDESDDNIISTQMLYDIRDRSKFHPNVDQREVSYKYVIVLN